MKKFLISVTIMFCALLISCGNNSTEEPQEFYDITRESRQPFNEKENEDYLLVGAQYYQGVSIQLWAERSQYFDENGKLCVERDIYIITEDGSKELLVENVSVEDVPHGKWWVDEQDKIFVLEADGIKALDRQGNILFHTETGENVLDICMLSDGNYILLLRYNGEFKLAELNSNTGKIEVFEKIILSGGDTYIAPAEDGLMLIGGEGVYKLNLEDGKKEYIMSWSGTSYSWAWECVGDFLVKEDGSVEVLFETAGIETLKYEKLSDGKIPITIRNVNFSNWMKEQIVIFNQTNPTYYVILEEKDENTDYQTFRERTDMLLAAGQGADVIMYSAMNDFNSLLGKGAFEDLSSYLKKSNIEKDNYFKNTFLYKDNALYGINTAVEMGSLWLDGELVAGMDEINIESLMEQLNNYQEKAVFYESASSGQTLNLWLEGSEDLWGMIDWERGKCDFSGGLFKDMVEMAARYGDSANNGYPAVAGLLVYGDAYNFAHEHADLKTEGNQAVGWFFDDGCYPFAGFAQMATINANSKHKEGAWELIEYLLSRDAQENWGEYGWLSGYPVNKESFYKMREFLLQREAENPDIFYFSDEQMDKLESEIESVHILPTKTLPILDIIYEETSEYFSGVKSLEEVIDVIENRVQLYLDEIS